MTGDEIAQKLRQIARLSPDELIGWHNFLTGVYATGRNPFDGERAALMSRANELKITLGE